MSGNSMDTTSSTTVSVSQSTLSFLESLVKRPAASALSIERQKAVLRTEREKVLSGRRKIRARMRADAVKLETATKRLSEIEKEMERLEALKEAEED